MPRIAARFISYVISANQLVALEGGGAVKAPYHVLVCAEGAPLGSRIFDNEKVGCPRTCMNNFTQAECGYVSH